MAVSRKNLLCESSLSDDSGDKLYFYAFATEHSNNPLTIKLAVARRKQVRVFLSTYKWILLMNQRKLIDECLSFISAGHTVFFNRELGGDLCLTVRSPKPLIHLGTASLLGTENDKFGITLNKAQWDGLKYMFEKKTQEFYPQFDSAMRCMEVHITQYEFNKFSECNLLD